MFKTIKYYLSPFFLSKHYIKCDLRKTILKYSFSGDLLDIGCGSKPYESLFKNVNYYGIDFVNYSKNKGFVLSKPDFFFKKDYLKKFELSFDSEKFDVVTSFQVLEHHKSPYKMISEMVRITKHGGFVILTVPFLGGIHEEPNDYQRFTKYGLIELFQPFKCEILEIKHQGSLFSTISMLINEFVNNFAAKNKISYFISVLIFLPFLLFSFFCLFLDKIFKSEKIFFNYLVLIRKI